MKKLLSLILALGMLLALCACGTSGATETDVEPEASETVENAELAEEPDAEQESEVASDTESIAAEDASGEMGSSSHGPSGERTGGPTIGGGGMGGMQKNDPALTALLEEVENKYIQDEYTDEETGLTVPYNLYAPDNFAEISYPMVTFITDMSVVGRDTTAALEQGYGGVIWASAEDQEKHPCVVLVPEFPTTIITDTEASDYVELMPRMILAVAEKYNVDLDRLYATGQSMGCMTFLNVTANNPDLFAAELFVSGQQPIEILTPLETQSFIYITAGGDMNASGGADEVMAMFDADGISYSVSFGWDAQADAEELNGLAEAMLSEGQSKNFARFEAGTVLAEGASTQGAAEHMASFDYAYSISALRDWLFQQSK